MASRGGVGAAAGHDGHAALGLFDRDADDLAVLLDVDRRRFAGGADDADAVGAFGDVPVDQPAQGGIVDAAVVVHRRDQRDDAACNRCHGNLFVCRKAAILLTGRAARAGSALSRAMCGGGNAPAAAGPHGGDPLDEALGGSSRKPSS